MSRVISILHKIEDALLVSLLLLMIGLAVFQIVLRNGFDAGIVWADPLVITSYSIHYTKLYEPCFRCLQETRD